MNIISQSFNTAGKFFRVRYKVTLIIALLHRPAIVDYYVFVTCIFISILFKGISDILNKLFIDLCIESVPAVPAHRWCGSKVWKFLAKNQTRNKQKQYCQCFFHSEEMINY